MGYKLWVSKWCTKEVVLSLWTDISQRGLHCKWNHGITVLTICASYYQLTFFDVQPYSILCSFCGQEQITAQLWNIRFQSIFYLSKYKVYFASVFLRAQSSEGDGLCCPFIKFKIPAVNWTQLTAFTKVSNEANTVKW